MHIAHDVILVISDQQPARGAFIIRIDGIDRKDRTLYRDFDKANVESGVGIFKSEKAGFVCAREKK
jgi:hypothetical protein